MSRYIKTVSPAVIRSRFRTWAFRGRRYAFAFLSGNIEVSQVVFPKVARTGTDPHPLFTLRVS